MRTCLTTLVLLALVGCGEASSGSTPAPEGGDEPVSAAALAWVAAEHVGVPRSAEAEFDIAEELGARAVGAELRYAAEDEQSDGDVLVVAVGRTGRRFTCDARGGRCAETEQGSVFWERAAPEEDPGNVGVALVKDAVTVLVFQSGPAITGDPRDLDLEVSVEDMFAVAADPRVDVTTSEEAVAAGAELDYWND